MDSRPGPRRFTVTAANLVVGMALVGCSGSGPAAPAAVTGGEPTFAHVHGLGIDPADGAVYVATHDGLFRSRGDGLQLVGAAGRDLMGFTIAGPGTFLAGGHPARGDGSPNPIGLAESRDAVTWTTLSLAGKVDFHALEISAGEVYGYDATNGLLRASADGGRTWQDRAGLAALDIAADPRAVGSVLATVDGGVAISRDGGSTFSAPTGPPLAYLSWAPDGTVYGIGLGGAMFASLDDGRSWQQVGMVPGGRPQAVTATADALLAATAGGIYRSQDDGRTFTPIG